MDDPAVAGQRGAGDDLIRPVDLQRLRLLVDEQRQERRQIAGIQGRGVDRDPARHIPRPDDLDALVLDHLPRLRQRAIAPLLHRQIDDHRTGLHRFHHLGRHQHRRLPAGDERCADHDVLLADRVGDQLRLRALVIVAHLAGIAAGGLRLFGLLALDHHETGAQALHLLLRHRPHVGRRHDGAQPPRGGDRLQPGDARAHHEDTGRRHRAGGGHHHRKGVAELGGGIQHRLVAGEVGLAGQHVHRLGAGNARHQLHRKRVDLALGVLADRFGALIGRQHADQQRTRPDHRIFVQPFGGAHRPLHLQYDVGIAQRLGFLRGHHGAGGAIGLVGDRRVQPGARLDHDVEAKGDQLFDGFGSRRDTPLMGAPLLGNGQLHRRQDILAGLAERGEVSPRTLQ